MYSRWEMDHLFGINHAMSKVSDLEDYHLEDERAVRNFGLSVDWRCLFSELFQQQNEAARLSFLACEDTVYHAPRSQRLKYSHLTADMQLGELSWNRVPNRLRCVHQSDLSR